MNSILSFIAGVVVGFALCHLLFYASVDASYDCKKATADYLLEMNDFENYHLAHGVYAGSLHNWVMCNKTGVEVWIEPQTGWDVSGADGYILLSYDSPFFCCKKFNKLEVDICTCSL